jgi:type IV pilus assembly protein PilM
MAKSAWGIELGTSSVKAVKMSSDRGAVTLDAVQIISLRDFGLGSGTNAHDATAGALNELRVSMGIRRGEQVFVSISGQNTLGRIISLPPVSKEKVRETIENEARSQIPIKLEEAVWDFQVIEDDTRDEELKVNLYAAKRDAVNQIVDVCESAGIQITGIQVAPLGIYNYVKYEFDDDVSDCCVALDIGADNTDVVIIDGQKTYVRVVPVAGNDITRALRAKFKLSRDDAENLKRNAGRSKDAAEVFEAMKPPLREMVGEIYRAVGFYKSQNEDANLNQLVMMGNGSRLLNIKKFFEQQLQYQVHKVETPARISLSRAVDPTEVQDGIQSLTVAIGLALQGLELDGLNSINLVPPEYVTSKASEKLRVPFFVGGAIAAAGGVLALLIAMASAGGVEPVVSQARDAVTAAGARGSALQDRLDVGDQHLRAISMRNLFEGRVGVLDAADGDAGPQQLSIKAASVPGLLVSAADAVMGGYLESHPGAQAYFADLGAATRLEADQRLPGMNQVSFFVGLSEAPVWDAAAGYYRVSRIGRLRMHVAVELVQGAAPDVAAATFQQFLGTGAEGRMAREVRRRIVDELTASGHSVTDQELERVRWSAMTVVVNRLATLAVTQVSQRENPLLEDIAPLTQPPVDWLRDGTLERLPTVRVQDQPAFVVTEVVVTLNLDPVTPTVEAPQP